MDTQFRTPKSPSYWSLMMGSREAVAEQFARLPMTERMRLLDQHPAMYWRALDMYVDLLADRLQNLRASLRLDRLDHQMDRLSGRPGKPRLRRG